SGVEPEPVGPTNPSEKILAGGKGVVRRPTPLLNAAPAPTTHGTGPGVIEPEYLTEPSADILANRQGVRVRPVIALPTSPVRGALPGIRMPEVSDSSVLHGKEVTSAPSASAAAELIRARQSGRAISVPSAPVGTPASSAAAPHPSPIAMQSSAKPF